MPYTNNTKLSRRLTDHRNAICVILYIARLTVRIFKIYLLAD